MALAKDLRPDDWRVHVGQLELVAQGLHSVFVVLSRVSWDRTAAARRPGFAFEPLVMALMSPNAHVQASGVRIVITRLDGSRGGVMRLVAPACINHHVAKLMSLRAWLGVWLFAIGRVVALDKAKRSVWLLAYGHVAILHVTCRSPSINQTITPPRAGSCQTKETKRRLPTTFCMCDCNDHLNILTSYLLCVKKTVEQLFVVVDQYG
jgi:hypothetical protein